MDVLFIIELVVNIDCSTSALVFPNSFRETEINSSLCVDTIVGNLSVCAGDIEYYSTSGAYGASSYNWTIPDDATMLSSNGNYYLILQWGSSSGPISVIGTNDCGVSENYSLEVTVKYPSGEPRT